MKKYYWLITDDDGVSYCFKGGKRTTTYLGSVKRITGSWDIHLDKRTKMPMLNGFGIASHVYVRIDEYTNRKVRFGVKKISQLVGLRLNIKWALNDDEVDPIALRAIATVLDCRVSRKSISAAADQASVKTLNVVSVLLAYDDGLDLINGDGNYVREHKEA